MGQRNGFSNEDVVKINMKYKCGSDAAAFLPNPLQRPIIIDKDTDEDSSESTTTVKPTRPNRPVLSLLGGLVSQAIQG